MISRFGSKKTKFPAFAAVLFIILACSVFVNASNLEVHHSNNNYKGTLPIKASARNEKNKAGNSPKVDSNDEKAAETEQPANNKKTAPVIVHNKNSVNKGTAPATKREAVTNINKPNKTTTNEKKPDAGNKSNVTEEVPFDEENPDSTQTDVKSAEGTAEQTSESGSDGTYLK